MKNLVQSIFITAVIISILSALTSVSAKASEDEVSYRGQMLRRMHATDVNASTRAVALETYYGETIETASIIDREPGPGVASLLNEREVRLRNGSIFNPADVEYVYEEKDSSNARAPHERAPHE